MIGCLHCHSRSYRCLSILAVNSEEVTPGQQSVWERERGEVSGREIERGREIEFGRCWLFERVPVVWIGSGDDLGWWVGVIVCWGTYRDRVLRGTLAVDWSLQLCRDVVGCWVGGGVVMIV